MRLLSNKTLIGHLGTQNRIKCSSWRSIVHDNYIGNVYSKYFSDILMSMRIGKEKALGASF